MACILLACAETTKGIGEKDDYVRSRHNNIDKDYLCIGSLTQHNSAAAEVAAPKANMLSAVHTNKEKLNVHSTITMMRQKAKQTSIHMKEVHHLLELDRSS